MGTSREQGFSLIEALLSVGILALLAGLSLPIYNSFIGNNDLALASQNVASMLRRASSNARASQSDSQWGVHFQTNTATLFKGTSFASRDSNFDENFSLANISNAYSGDVVFSKMSGLPDSARTISLTSIVTNSNKVVSINEKGMVGY